MNIKINPFSFAPKTRIHFAKDKTGKELPVDGFVRGRLNLYKNDIEKIAKKTDRDVVIAQKGHTLLVNSGAKTSVIKMDSLEKGYDLISKIIDNIFTNANR